VRNFISTMDPLSITLRFGQPAFTIVVLGVMFGTLVPASAVSSGSYTAFLVPGMVAFQMVTGAVISANLFWLDRRWAMVEQIFSGPFLRAEYLAGLVITTLLFALVGVCLMLLVAVPFIGLPTLTLLGFLVVILAITLGSIFFAGTLIALGSRLRSANAYFAIQSFLQLFLVFLSTVYYPITSSTPRLLAYILECNPLTYAANTIRDAFHGTIGSSDLVFLSILGVLAVAAFALAVRGFQTMDPGPIQ
jgi:ABC-2 type transport system permease protein